MASRLAMRTAQDRTSNEIGGGLEKDAGAATPTTAVANTAWLRSTLPSSPRLGNALRPLRPTVSMDARPVLIPILSSVTCFPIVALAVICVLRYRALRLRRKELQRRLRAGGMSAARLEIPGRGTDRPSIYSHDSSSGDTSWRPSVSIDYEDPRGPSPAALSSPSSGDNYYADEVVRGRPAGKRRSLASGNPCGCRRSSRAASVSATTVLQLLEAPSPRHSTPQSTTPQTSSPPSSSPQSSRVRCGSVSFLVEPSFRQELVCDYGGDADDDGALSCARSDSG